MGRRVTSRIGGQARAAHRGQAQAGVQAHALPRSATRRPAWQLLACALLLLPATASTAQADPRIDYMLNCQGCHLEDGHGVRGVMPGLRDEVGSIAGVPGGRDYLMRVPGVANSTLPSPELAGVLNWVMDNFNAATRPPGFTPFTADEVAKARVLPLADPGQARTRIYRAPDY